MELLNIMTYIASKKSHGASLRYLRGMFTGTEATLRRYLSRLKKEGILEMCAKSCYRLARSPELITVSDVLDCTGLPVEPFPCDYYFGVRECPKARTCLVKDFIRVANDSFRGFIDRYTLGDVLSNV